MSQIPYLTHAPLAGFQGTPLRAKGSPILDLAPPLGITPGRQRTNFDLLAKLNAAQHPGHDKPAAHMDDYELAFRMQAQVPETLELSRENPKTKELYGIVKDTTDAFGKNAFSPASSWKKACALCNSTTAPGSATTSSSAPRAKLVRGVDQLITALITQIKQRGLLDSMLVVWCGEFGRTPDNRIRGGIAHGRDHNPNAMTIWLAGGGCNAGHRG